MSPSTPTIQRFAAHNAHQVDSRSGAFHVALAAAGAALIAAAWLLLLATSAPAARADDSQSSGNTAKFIQLLRADDFGGSQTRVRDGAFASKTVDVFDGKLAQASGL